ncbi:MAG: sporulation protein YunB [Clostridia bacterium]|nr:sporulation protein YunB [Clostridia bacterium]
MRWERISRWMLAAAIFVGFLNGYRETRSLVAIYGENRCRNLVVRCTAEAVSNAETDGKLIDFTGAEGANAFQLDSKAARAFQQSVSVQLADRLEHLGEQSHHVRLGTVLDSLLLMDRGPEVVFRFVPVGAARTAVSSDLRSAGINQVLYRAILEVQVEMTVLLPGGNKTILCEQRIPLEEVLIRGDVPLVYGENVATE